MQGGIRRLGENSAEEVRNRSCGLTDAESRSRIAANCCQEIICSSGRSCGQTDAGWGRTAAGHVFERAKKKQRCRSCGPVGVVVMLVGMVVVALLVETVAVVVLLLKRVVIGGAGGSGGGGGGDAGADGGS